VQLWQTGNNKIVSDRGGGARKEIDITNSSYTGNIMMIWTIQLSIFPIKTTLNLNFSLMVWMIPKFIVSRR